ncbi:tumor necrosis factor ligand superfamily member 18 [Lissotriton helveticus]
MSNSEVEAKSKETEIFIGDTSVPKTVSGQRCRLLLLSALVSMVLAVLVSTCFILLLLPRYKTRPICLARSVPVTLPSVKEDWTWTMHNCSNHFREDGEKLEVLKEGVYIIYIHVTHNPIANGPYSDLFTVRLMKKSNGEESILSKMTEYTEGMNCSSCQPYISVAHPYQLQKGDLLYLKFNNFTNVSKTMTFWGVYEIAPVTVSSSALFQESA